METHLFGKFKVGDIVTNSKTCNPEDKSYCTPYMITKAMLDGEEGWFYDCVEIIDSGYGIYFAPEEILEAVTSDDNLFNSETVSEVSHSYKFFITRKMGKELKNLIITDSNNKILEIFFGALVGNIPIKETDGLIKQLGIQTRDIGCILASSMMGIFGQEEQMKRMPTAYIKELGNCTGEFCEIYEIDEEKIRWNINKTIDDPDGYGFFKQIRGYLNK